MSRLISTVVLVGSAALVGVVGPAGADGHGRPLFVRAWLTGFEETPLTLSSPGRGFFRAVVDEDAGTIQYSLTYDGVANVAQSHLHLGAHHTTGGISVFLCSNLGNGPAGTQACPTSPAQISGTIHSTDVIGPVGQGIAPGEFAELVTAIRNKAVYVNVHSQQFPGGEIRGQLL
jgi:CHRD domain-containing protein